MKPGSRGFRRAILLIGAVALSGTASGTTFTVTVAPGGSFSFSPSSLTINVGDTVNWVWSGSGHSTTSGSPCTADGKWDSGVQSNPFNFSFTFTSAGTYPYFCVPHCDFGMTGQIIVQQPTVTPTPTATAATTVTPTPTPTTGSPFFAVAPCRVADTRNAPGPSGGPALAANTVRTFPVTGLCGIPASARAVAINLAVFNPSNDGDLRVYPAGGAAPLASAINFRPGIVRANNAIIPLGTGGQIAVQCDMPAGSTNFFFDVYGYLQ